jgi:hypothetical protein
MADQLSRYVVVACAAAALLRGSSLAAQTTSPTAKTAEHFGFLRRRRPWLGRNHQSRSSEPPRH